MGTVHFTLGENMGKVLSDIAYEKLIDTKDVDQALNVFESSMIGLDRHFAESILFGKRVIDVDENGREFIIRNREEGDTHRYFDPVKYLSYEIKKLNRVCRSHYEALVASWRDVGKNIFAQVQLSFDDAISLKRGDDKDRAIDIIDGITPRTSRVMDLVIGCQDLIEETATFDKFMRQFPDLDMEGFPDLSYQYYARSISTTLMDLNQGKAPKVEEDAIQCDLDNYLEASSEIDKIDNIAQVDIIDNYDAGWIGPDGEYYGLNGEIANMLHINLAALMQEAGVIPDMEADEEGTDYKDPSRWLEEAGWIKQQGNRIYYDGYNLDPVVPITEAQKNAIVKFGQHCHKGLLSLGFKHEKLSAARVDMMDIPGLAKYLKW